MCRLMGQWEYGAAGVAPAVTTMAAAIGTDTGTAAGMAEAMAVDTAGRTAVVRGATAEVAAAMGDMDDERGWRGG